MYLMGKKLLFDLVGVIPLNMKLIIILKDFAVGQSTDGAAPIAANTLTYYNYVNK